MNTTMPTNSQLSRMNRNSMLFSLGVRHAS